MTRRVIRHIDDILGADHQKESASAALERIWKDLQPASEKLKEAAYGPGLQGHIRYMEAMHESLKEDEGDLDDETFRECVRAAREHLLAGEDDIAAHCSAEAEIELTKLLCRHDPALQTGEKIRRNLNQARESAIQQNRAEMSERQGIIRSLLPTTRLTKGALELHLQRKLRDDYGLDVSTRTIRRDLRKLGHTR